MTKYRLTLANEEDGKFELEGNAIVLIEYLIQQLKISGNNK